MGTLVKVIYFSSIIIINVYYFNLLSVFTLTIILFYSVHHMFFYKWHIGHIYLTKCALNCRPFIKIVGILPYVLCTKKYFSLWMQFCDKIKLNKNEFVFSISVAPINNLVTKRSLRSRGNEQAEDEPMKGELLW